MGVMKETKDRIPYSNDFACADRLRLFHEKGNKNIYSVKVCYSMGPDYNPTRRKELHMDYGTFALALERFRCEISADYIRPAKWRMDNIYVVVMTYCGTKLVNEEVMFDKFSRIGI